MLDNLEEGIILDNKDIIELYICKYYKKLYTDEPYDESLQTEFLELINNKLRESDIEHLQTEITENEIFIAIKDLSINKAPEIDGIPTEFYQNYWGIIKKRICSNHKKCYYRHFINK